MPIIIPLLIRNLHLYCNKLKNFTNPSQHKDGECVENGGNNSRGDQTELGAGRAAEVDRH